MQGSTAPEATSSNTDPTGPDSLAAGLLHDPTVRVSLLAVAGVALAYLPTAFSRRPLLTWSETTVILLLISIWALRYRLREVEGAARRRFWNLLTVALVLWIIGTVLGDLPIQGSSTLGLLSDFLDLLSYLALFLAAEIRTDRDAARPSADPQQIIDVAGAILFFFGSFLYFNLIPGLPTLGGVYSWVPGTSLFVAQAFYLTLRFWHLSHSSKTRRWRLSYRFLAITTSSWMVTTLLYFPYFRLDFDALPALDLLWYSWFPPFIVAVRLRHHTLADERPRPYDSSARSYWIPLVVATVLLPFLHLLIYSLNLGDTTFQRPRDQLVLVYLLVLGFMALLQQRAKDRNAATLEVERGRAEEVRNRFTQILEATTDIVLMTDRHGRTLYLNRAGRGVLGFGDDEDLSRLSVSAYHSHSVAEVLVRKGMPAAIERGAWRQEANFLTREGREIPTLLVLVAHKDASGEVEFFSTIARDVSQRERRARDLLRAREAADAAGRAKDEFVATISHEIRTPMNGVIGMASLLHHTPLSGKQLRYLDTIRISSEVLLSTIDDVLDFGKIEWGNLDLNRAPFEPRALIEDALEVVSQAATAKNLGLSFRIKEDASEHLVGDVSRIRQILVNLLSNAVKFTDRGQVSVSLSVRPASDGRTEAHFAVEDTGIGILPEKRDRLFQPFSQVDVSTTREFGGTGLGLAICKRLSELMGGRIWVESTAGKGSRFHFTILGDVAPAPDATGQGSRFHLPPSGEPAATEGTEPVLAAAPRVLVAEDNPVNQMVALGMLEKLGYQADTVANGIEALEALRHRSYDVVLMDVRMPVMDGLEATRRICREHGVDGLPRIIGLTAHAMRGDRERCLAAGMHDYLSKPFEIGDLQVALRSTTVSGA